MNRNLWIVALGVITWCAPVQAAEKSANLLRNPGFEEGTSVPSPWQFNRRGTHSEIALDRGKPCTGAASVRITNKSAQDSGNVLQTVTFDPPLAVGTSITFSAFAAGDNAGGNGPQIIVSLYSTSGARQDAVAKGIGGTHLFEKISDSAVVARTTDRIVVYLCHYGTGTVWWDDASLTVDRAPASKVQARPVTAAKGGDLSTADGLTVGLSGNGGVTQIGVADKHAAIAGRNSGLWIHPYRRDTIPVTGQVTATAGSITQRWRDDHSGLEIEAQFKTQDDRIGCRGSVTDLTRTDRGVDVIFSLPVGGKGWRWGRSIREEVPLGSAPEQLDATTFASVSRPEDGAGIALAVPTDSPCDCEFTWDPSFGFAVRFRFGLTPEGAGPLQSRAPFAFILYRCDGEWGLRDAARRYYAFYPDAFVKRAKREGLWMFGSPRFPIPDPQNYAFHEGGPAGWEYDDEHQIATCPYIIPGQREVMHLLKLPGDKREALSIFTAWQPPPKQGAAEMDGDMKAIIENCLLQGSDGLPEMNIRNTPWGGNSITFPLDASPQLFADTTKPTIAKSLLDSVRTMHAQIPDLDGTYVDSLGAWGDYLDFRHDHFRYARIPFTYDPVTGRPVISNRFSLLEFLWALGDTLYPHGKLLFANGLHPNRRFHFFSVDVLGVEGHNDLDQKRVMAYRKPFLLLIYDILDQPAKMDAYYQLCTFYGIYPSFANMSDYKTPESYAPVARLNNRFVPVLRAITSAGWEPITDARSSDADVWLERWGDGAKGEFFLTCYNSASNARTTTIDIDTRAIGLTGTKLSAADKLSSDRWAAEITHGHAKLTMSVPPGATRVLQITAQ